MSLPATTREYRLPEVNGFHCLTLQDAHLRAPGSTEVLVKIHAVSLQHRDLIVAQGLYPDQKENIVPCSDMAGEILAIGDDVKGWSIGDRVCANFAVDHTHGDVTEHIKMTSLGGILDGVLTEYKLLPAHCLVMIPSHLSFVEASTLPCAAVTAYNALMGPVPLKGGDTVLILGTGGVSMFGLQLAVASGATVIITSSSDAKLALAAKHGATHLVNYKVTPDWEEEVLRITKGRGVDHVLDVGGPRTLPRSVKCVRYAGWVHVIGFIAGRGDPSSLFFQIMSKGVVLRAIRVGSRTQFEDMNRLISASGLKPIVNKVFGFEDAKEAYAYLEKQQHVGKVVIQVVGAQTSLLQGAAISEQ